MQHMFPNGSPPPGYSNTSTPLLLGAIYYNRLSRENIKSYLTSITKITIASCVNRQAPFMKPDLSSSRPTPIGCQTKQNTKTDSCDKWRCSLKNKTILMQW